MTLDFIYPTVVPIPSPGYHYPVTLTWVLSI